MSKSEVVSRIGQNPHQWVANPGGGIGGQYGYGVIAPGPNGAWMAAAVNKYGPNLGKVWLLDIVDTKAAAVQIATAYGIGGC